MYVVSLVGKEILCLWGKLYCVAQFGHSLYNLRKFKVYDADNGIKTKLVEIDYLIHSVYELRSETLVQCLLYDRT